MILKFLQCDNHFLTITWSGLVFLRIRAKVCSVELGDIVNFVENSETEIKLIVAETQWIVERVYLFIRIRFKTQDFKNLIIFQTSNNN